MVIWLTGLAGSGKTTLARALLLKLRKKGLQNSLYLDGDEFREIIGDLGYDKEARIAVAKKRAKFCQFLSNQGLIVIASSISMFKENYLFNRQVIRDYFEVYVKCDMKELKKRNQKGLYSGQIKDVVGLDIDFDEPNADLILDNDRCGIDENLAKLVERVALIK